MSNDKRNFDVVGTSVKKGTHKVRWANGCEVSRTLTLVKDGQTDVKLRKMPEAKSKADAVKWLLTQEVSVAERALLEAELKKLGAEAATEQKGCGWEAMGAALKQQLENSKVAEEA